MEQDWENLPKHLLDSVAEKLLKPLDYLGFSLVCKTWYSVAKDNESKHPRMTAPMLLFYSGRKQYWNFYDVIDKKVLKFQAKVPWKVFVGSSKGWLLFVHRNVREKNLGVTLVNPFLRIKGRKNKENTIICLPPLTPPGWEKWYVNCEEYVCKATISADPISNTNDCIVTVIHLERGNLAFIRLGKDTTWTYVDESVDNALDEDIGCQMIEEVVNVGNTFYAVNYYREVLCYDVTTGWTYSDVKMVRRGNSPDCNNSKRYIFEVEENRLLMVERYRGYTEDDIRVTKKFRVFELNVQTGEWTEKNTLGGDALFVGDNTSIRVSSAKICGLRSNCIYFNHDIDYVGTGIDYDFGVYNVEDQSFPETYTKRFKKILQMSSPRPIWVKPILSFPFISSYIGWLGCPATSHGESS
ncbi:hypothetical protein ACLB2K_008050 [Fragaria x ananassa]